MAGVGELIERACARVPDRAALLAPGRPALSYIGLRELITSAAEGLQATGRVGDANPVLAVLDACLDTDYDEIVVSTLPAGPSRWLRRDLPNRIRRVIDVPVAHIVAARAPAVH